MKNALLFGSTGLIGNELAKILSNTGYYNKIICFVRKNITTPIKGIEYIITDFSDLHTHRSQFTDADVYCCLGTTIRAVGYDKEKFKEADLYRPVQIATIAKSAGAGQFLVVSAMGANKKSSIFYNQVKGELEEKLSALQLPSLQIAHPSMLLGPRIEKRTGERIAQAISTAINPLMIGGLKKYRPIQAHAVALAMFHIAKKNDAGEHVWLSDALQNIADGR